MVSQVISTLELFVVTTATRTMEKMTTIMVSEKMLIRAIFFFHEIWTFHNMRIGIVITTRILAD